MEGYLNSSQIEYVLYHLHLTFQVDQELTSHFEFIRDNTVPDSSAGRVIFQLSSMPLDLDRIQWIENIPILFPLGSQTKFYVIENGQLIFHHDLLKSAFYLLSGYQEYSCNKKDTLNRYPFSESIQYKLNITHRPIVNYYFDIIRRGINEFCGYQNSKYEMKKVFNDFGFLLTHDIDRVDFYDIHRIKLLLKQLVGLYKADDSKQFVIKSLIKSIIQYLRGKKQRNPYWNFDYLQRVEKQNNMTSVYYFLHKDQMHVDSYYAFEEKRIRELIDWLEDNGCEIGIHGTVKSASDEQNSYNYLKKLDKITSEDVHGIRQHRLVYDFPVTTRIHEKLNLQYDSTLGFAEHEGFRNSFCLPFKLYDFENERIFNVWEIPLVAMDVTLFHYRNLDLTNARSTLDDLLGEVEKFHGVFTLLWHNTFFDEHKIPGITTFYEQLLQRLSNNQAESVTGADLINMTENVISSKPEKLLNDNHSSI